MTPIESYELPGNRTLEIHHDSNCESPREWDNACRFICFHKRYNLGDKHDYDRSQFNGWDDLEEQIKEDLNVAIIRPLYLYDHGNIAISLCPFSDSWDSGQIGFAVLKQEELDSCFGGDLDRGMKCMEAEVEIYDDYRAGRVYGYKIIGPPCKECGAKGEEESSCWGFIGKLETNGILDDLSDEDREAVGIVTE